MLLHDVRRPPRLRGGNGRETQDFLCIARAIRVMCEARGRDTGPRRKNCEHFRVQTLLARLRKRVFESAPGKLVPEGESAVVTYHSDAQATLDARFVRAGGLLQQPGFSLPGITQTNSAISRAAGESLTARASTASRTVTGTVSAAAASTSVTKSGLPSVMLCKPFEGRPPVLPAVRLRILKAARATFCVCSRAASRQ